MEFLKPLSRLKLAFSLALSFLSLYFLLVEGGLYGLILLAVALRMGLREGIEINPDTKKIRDIYSIYAIKLGGKWKDIPEIEYISVFKTKKRTRARVITAEALMDSVEFRVNLFYNRNRFITAFASDEKKEAFVAARHLALALDVDILDATEKERVWL